MEEIYDVVIVGAGPAGLRCAAGLSSSGMKVLLLEQHTTYGDKLCAGGLTPNDMQLLAVPDTVIERKISKTALHTAGSTNNNRASAPFLYMVNRARFGAWLRSTLKDTNIEVRTGAVVDDIDKRSVQLRGGARIGYRVLVGADGSRSVVRRHLGLPVRRRLMGLQCALPLEEEDPTLEVHLRSEYFHAWYGWKFPHKRQMMVGCCADPEIYPAAKLKHGFRRWLEEMKLDAPAQRIYAWPINYDYRGLHFGNVFLAGDAAGLASGLTGEGIYQALVSGDEVARMILDPSYRASTLEAVLRYNRTLMRIRQVYLQAGKLRGEVQELTVWLMKQHWFRSMMFRVFS